ncbi:MAG: inorganic phosphate transporter [Solirubrobacterales bacterium]|nr:inorganic phosphate transporter [Solirubrobacterales bacterium]MBV9715615.1 inorganic phosphate transporter [Solirubrobacterales bacterium]
MGSELVLILVVIAAVAFDFTNGFHDTANAMATSIATGALKPKVAVSISAVLNFAGAFISISVAATIAKGIVNPTVLGGGDGLELVLAALIGAMTWNLITWYLAIPSSSSHALIGGVIGATIVATSSSAVNWHNLVKSVVIPAAFSPLIAGAVAVIGTFVAYKLIRYLGERDARTGYRFGQIGSASLVSLAHGTNDAQKTMGVISLALIAHGNISAAHFAVPFWVKLVCASAIALGTASGGWRIINTMGNRITNVESPQGFAAESSSASVILASSYFGYPLSTTQVVSGGVMGAGLGKRLASVRWGVVGQMASAWVFTIPAAAVLGGVAWEIANLFGSHTGAGSLAIAILACLAAACLWRLAQRNNIRARDLDRTHVAPDAEAEEPGSPVAVAA